MAFSPCGRYLASGSDDQTIRFWRRYSASECESLGIAPDGRVPGRQGDKWLEVDRIDNAHDRSIYSVSWTTSEDSYNLGKLASTGGDGKINVFYLVRINEAFSDNRLSKGMAK